LAVAALHLLQAALIYVNTLMIQDILAEPEWQNVLTPEDRRGLNPLFTSHMTPYGEVRLRMDSRLALTAPSAEPEPEPPAGLAASIPVPRSEPDSVLTWAPVAAGRSCKFLTQLLTAE